MPNRGVATPPKSPAALGWDWYTASLDADPEWVVHTLQKALSPCEGVATRAHPRYDAAWGLDRDGERLVSIHWGRKYSAPLVEATGWKARLAVPAIRGLNVPHKVSRADIALDLTEFLPYEEIASLALTVARAHGVSTDTRGDWFDGGKNGRTLYLGSPSSAARARIYEKGKEAKADLDVTRIEVQLRPPSTAKAYLAHCTPGQAFALMPSALDLASRLGVDLNLAVPETPLESRRRRDRDRARLALARQYVPTITKWLEEAGSPDAFLGELYRLRDADLDHRRRIRDAATQDARLYPSLDGEVTP